MIFGKIDFKIKEEDKTHEANSFAWLPVLLSDGRLAWLERVYKERWNCWGHTGNIYYLPKENYNE